MKKFNISIFFAFLSMIALVAASNYYVQFPINNWLTWGAVTYPITYFITELTNYFHGSKTARKIVYTGFALAVLVSAWLSTPRIAFASGTAFLVSQLLDIAIFNNFRKKSSWWFAAIFASLSISIVDTTVFWMLAFFGTALPLISLAIGDCAIKFLLDASMLCPLRFAIKKLPQLYRAS